jgi:hypothetical protein
MVEGAPQAPGPVGPNSISPDAKIGTAPEDYSRQFLRTQSVLLRQGQLNFDTGVGYGIAQSNYPDVVNGTFVEGTFRRRLIYVPTQLRYGLTDRIQLFANVPVGYVENQQTVVGGYDIGSGRGGTGDTNLGFSYWLHQANGCAFHPDVILTLGATLPTAPASFLSAVSAPQASLGQGFWAGNWNLLFVQSYDPVTIFYSIGGRDVAARGVDNTKVQPGQQFIYQLGAGFAVNDRVTLSTIFTGYYITSTYLNDQRLAGSVLEPQYLRFAATVSRQTKIIEPFAMVGLTQESARSIIGINVTFR